MKNIDFSEPVEFSPQPWPLVWKEVVNSVWFMLWLTNSVQSKRKIMVMFVSYEAHSHWYIQYLWALQFIHILSPNDSSPCKMLWQCFSLSTHPGGVWLGHTVAYTRQEGGPLPTQWPPSPATTASNSLQSSSRTGVLTHVLMSQWIQKSTAVTGKV